jgi:hypothetical protein
LIGTLARRGCCEPDACPRLWRSDRLRTDGNVLTAFGALNVITFH